MQISKTSRVAIVLALAVATPALAGWLFPHPTIPTSWSPYQVLSADFDDDGHLDLAVSCRDAQEVEVFLGNGDGTFAPPVAYPVNGVPTYMTLGDFDDDDHEDLAVSNRFDNRISVFLGNADGTFGPEAQFGQPADRAGIAVGDFNEDGKQDLLSVDDSQAYLLFGTGDGSFGQELVLPGDWVIVVVEDFDGDGSDDYAYGHWDDADLVTVQLGNGDGTFVSAGSHPVGQTPFGIAAGDVSGDQIPDLVVTNHSSDDISVLIGNGDGTFASEVRYPVGTIAPTANPVSVVISDLDEDGLQDLTVSNYWGARPAVSLFFGTGGGAFAPAVWGDASTGFAYTMAIDDFDEDGAKDLVRANYGGDEVNLVFGNGHGQFVTVNHEQVGELPVSVAVADLDGDGRLDIVTANRTTNDVSVLLADGAGSFAPEDRYCVVAGAPPCPGGHDPLDVAVAELTGDAHLDLAVTNYASSTVSVLEGDGAGSFAVLTNFDAGIGGWVIVASQVDADASTDLVLAGVLDDAIRVFLGNGDGTFVGQPIIPAGDEPVSLTLGHLDGDAHVDLVVPNENPGRVRVLLGVGDGSFVPAPTLLAGPDPTGTAVGDLNGDSMPDLAVIKRFSAEVDFFAGNGDGTFDAPVVLDGFNGTSIEIADLDADDRSDLAIGGTSLVGVLRGNGDGTFDAAQIYHTGFSEYGGIAAGDFNLDSRPDLATSAGEYDKASVLLNQSGPSVFTILPDHETLVWPAVTGATSYDVYRGDTSSLVDGNDDGLPDADYGACMTGLDPNPRDTFFVDADLPGSGDGFFYLINVVDPGGESGIGETSAGSPRVPAVACP